MKEPKRQSRRFKAPERTRQIINAARSLFAKQGYRDTTLDEVASAVGVSRARVVQLCGSKEELYKTIVEKAYEEHPLDKDIKEHMDSGDDLEVLKSYALHILDNYANPVDREILTILMYSRLHDDEFSREHFEKKDSLMISRLIYWASSRMAQGRLKRMDPQLVITSYQAMVMNLALYKHVLGQLDFAGNQELAKTCAEIFLNGLKTGEADEEE